MLARLTLTLVIAVTMLACDSPTTPTVAPTLPSAGPVAVFENAELSFEYPANWNEATYEVVTSFSQSIVFLSTEALRDPCSHSASSVSCGSPIEQLGEDGVLVSWSHWGVPGPVPTPAASSVPVEVGGRPATVNQEDATGDCANVGGQQYLTVHVDIPNEQGNWIEMNACVQGPNFELTGATIAAMLASVEWKS